MSLSIGNSNACMAMEVLEDALEEKEDAYFKIPQWLWSVPQLSCVPLIKNSDALNNKK